MTLWEYKTHTLHPPVAPLRFDELAPYGTEGWELVAVVPIGALLQYIFKRPYQLSTRRTQSFK